MNLHPIQRRVEILLVSSCHRLWDKLLSDGPLNWYADFTLFTFFSMSLI